jgi:serine/threonine protein kinase
MSLFGRIRLSATVPRTLSEITQPLSDFCELRELKRSEIGRTYEATNVRTGEEVHVKELLFGVPWEAKFAFSRSLETLSTIHNETLLSWIGFVTDNQRDLTRRWAIVTSNVHPRSIRDLDLCQNSAISSTQRFIMIYGICAGILILHSRNIIHFNLHPSNVLVNESMEPKLSDFGIFQFAPRDLLIQHAKASGTIGFLAPEVLDGKKCDFSADIFSFGMLVYYILTGMVPCAQARNSKKPSISAKLLKRDYHTLMEQCWMDSPNARPSFEEIFLRLHAFNFAAIGVDTVVFNKYVTKIFGELFRSKLCKVRLGSNPIEWLLSCTENGGGFSANTLGMHSRDGDLEGIVQNHAKAAHYFRLSAESRNSLGIFNLGHAYEMGIGIDQSTSEAELYYSDAVGFGSPDAHFQMAKLI